MSLITEVMEHPLDPGYAAEAELRKRSGRSVSTGTRRPVLVVAAVLIGFLLAVAAMSLRVPASAATDARHRLIGEIEARQAAGDQQTKNLAVLRIQIERAQGAALTRSHETDLAKRLGQAEQAVGAVPLVGPGIRVSVDDASTDQGAADGDVNPRTQSETDAGRVTSSDLQLVTNGLWQAGAEAISINGQRLTAQSAIRFAGEAILVDFRPLTRPYVITALGSPDTLRDAFEHNPGGAYLASLEHNFSIRTSITADRNLAVPASSSLTLRVATPAPAPGPTSTSGPTATPATPKDSS